MGGDLDFPRHPRFEAEIIVAEAQPRQRAGPLRTKRTRQRKELLLWEPFREMVEQTFTVRRDRLQLHGENLFRPERLIGMAGEGLFGGGLVRFQVEEAKGGAGVEVA